MRRSTSIFLLAVLALAAFGLRVGVVAALRTVHARPLAYEHGRIAENLLAGRGFSIEFLGTEGPTSQQAPFYPLLLAAVYAGLGAGSGASILFMQLLQCVVGTGVVLAVVWLAWALMPERPSVGWIAGLVAAVYPSHLYMVTHLQVAVWAALLLTLVLAVVHRPAWHGTWRGAIVAGALAGLLLLVEPILALALPVAAAVFWLGERRLLAAAALGRAAAMAGVAALVIAPWSVRNWMVHGEPVFIKSTFGYAFWQGNHPLSWGTDKLPKPSVEAIRQDHDGSLRSMDRALWEARHETLYIDDEVLKPAGYGRFQGLSEPRRSALLGREALGYIGQDPARYVKLCLRRLRYFFLFDETNPKAANRVYRVSTAAWLVLGLIGLIVSGPRWRRLWPTYAIFAAVAAFHALVIVSARFRIPVEPISFIWIGAGLAPLVGTRPIKVWRPAERPCDPLGALGDPERAGPPGGRRRMAA